MATKSPHTALTDLWLTDPPVAWKALGFELDGDSVALDGVALHLGAAKPALAINPLAAGELDGVPLLEPAGPPHAMAHPNGVTAIDHFVIVTPDFERTRAALESHGMPFKRIRQVGEPGDPNTFRQGFRRLGPAILEVVESEGMAPGPARFWGLTMIAEDLDALAALLGPDRLRPIKAAVQAGRRIATLDRAAGLSTNVAFMDPEVRRSL